MAYLTSYTENNPYTCQEDGYARLNVWAAGSTAELYVVIDGKGVKMQSVTYAGNTAVFIRKNMKLYATITGESANAVSVGRN